MPVHPYLKPSTTALIVRVPLTPKTTPFPIGSMALRSPERQDHSVCITR